MLPTRKINKHAVKYKFRKWQVLLNKSEMSKKWKANEHHFHLRGNKEQNLICGKIYSIVNAKFKRKYFNSSIIIDTVEKHFQTISMIMINKTNFQTKYHRKCQSDKNSQ